MRSEKIKPYEIQNGNLGSHYSAACRVIRFCTSITGEIWTKMSSTNAEVKPSDRGIYFIMVSELTRINSPDAQSSSSAPFSQSFSPSHLHDNETHLLVDPPQSNFSGGHVCLPVGRDKRDREITVVLWSIKATTTTTRRHSWT